METKLTKIFLHGKLGKTYGKEWNLAVKSPAEAIRAIDINVGGALKRQLISEGKTKFYKICLGNKNNYLEKEEIANPSGNVDIHIIPAIKGKNSGVGKILAAIALVVVTYYTFGAGSGLAAGADVMGGLMTAGQATMIGYTMAASLLLGGVTQLLSPSQGANYGSSNDDGRGSSIFQGNSSIVSQGAAVGLVYGRMLVTPMPVALAFNNYDSSPPAGKDIDPQCYSEDYKNGLMSYLECP